MPKNTPGRIIDSREQAGGVIIAYAGVGSGTVPIHALADHTGVLADAQAPQFLKTDGSRALTGNLAVDPGVLIDNVDLSAFYSAYSTHTHAHSSLANIGANDHHNQRHALTGADHTASGLTAGHVVRASGATAFAWAQLGHGDLGGVTPDQHHNKQHGILSDDHTVAGAIFQTIGLTAVDTLGLLTPRSDVTGTTKEALLKSDAAGGLTLQKLAVGGAMTLYGGGNVGAAPDIQFTGAGMIAAESSLYINIDSTNTTTGSNIIIMRDAATNAGTELFRFTESGRLGIGVVPAYDLDVEGTARASVAMRTATAYATTKVQTPLLDTASGQNMTIEPAGDLYLMPDGLDVVVNQAASLRSDNFLKTILTAGFRIGPTSVAGQTGVQAGSAEFDELRARIFVADETRVDRGQWYLTKSYGILSRPFTVPASVGGTAFLYIENSPNVAGALFSTNDWVMLAYLNIDGGIVLTKVWGQVSAYNVTGLTGEQRWTFTLRSGTGGLEFAKGALGLDFGASGQGYILMDAVTATAPSIQVGRWVGANPYTPANYEVLTAVARLDDVGFTGEYGLAASVSGYGVDAQWLKVSTAGGQLNNLPLLLTSGGVVKVSIAAWNDVWFGPSSSDKRLSWDGSTFAIVGQVTATSGYIGTAAAGWTISSNAIYNDYVRLLSGGPSSAYARIEVGDYANTSAGLIGNIGLRGADGAAASIGMWAGRNYANRASAPFRVTLGGSLYAADATLVGSLTAGAGNVVLDANGGRLYRESEIVTTGSLPPTNFTLSPNLIPAPPQALQLRDTDAVFTRTGSPSSYAYPGNILLRLYTSSRHWTPPADPLLWEHHLYGVIEVPAPTQVGLGMWYTSLWLKARSITLSSVAGVHAMGGFFADTLAVDGNASVRGALRIQDDGGGENDAVSFSNVTDTTVSTGTGAVKMNGATNRDSNAWVKIYIGTTAYWIPAWSNIN